MSAPTATRARIFGIGTARPPRTIAQEHAAEAAADCCADSERRESLLAELYRQTTVRTRGSTLLKPGDDDTIDADSLRWFYNGADGDASPNGPSTYDRMRRFRDAAPPLAAEACTAALDSAGVTPNEITHLVTVSCTGFASPGVEVELIKRLGLRLDVTRTHVGFMGCHAAINGLQVARAFAEADPAARVLMCCVELCSLHFQYGWDSQRMVANALFADGAGAAVIGADDVDPRWRLADTASAFVPNSEDEMSWHVGDHGFVMTLSSRVPQLIGEHVQRWITPWLARHKLTVADVGSWAVHPGGPRIVTAVADALELSDDAVARSRDVLQTHGNMSSATVLFILESMMRDNAPRPCVAMSFGPGLISEAALLV